MNLQQIQDELNQLTECIELISQKRRRLNKKWDKADLESMRAKKLRITRQMEEQKMNHYYTLGTQARGGINAN